MHALVPEASERGSPHYNSAKVVGGGQPTVVRGQRWRVDPEWHSKDLRVASPKKSDLEKGNLHRPDWKKKNMNAHLEK